MFSWGTFQQQKKSFVILIKNLSRYRPSTKPIMPKMDLGPDLFIPYQKSVKTFASDNKRAL